MRPQYNTHPARLHIIMSIDSVCIIDPSGCAKRAPIHVPAPRRRRDPHEHVMTCVPVTVCPLSERRVALQD